MLFDLFLPLLSRTRSRREDGYCTKHTKCEVCAMSTLLNYGFTANPKTAKRTASQPEKSIESTKSASGTAQAAPVRYLRTSLPPIPRTAPISIPQLERPTSKRLSSPVVEGDSRNSISAPKVRPRSPPLPKLPTESEPEKPADVGAGSPIEFTATLFPPPKTSVPTLKKPSQGLHRSSRRIQSILQNKHISQLAVPSAQPSTSRSMKRSSIGATPISAYAGPHKSKPALALQTHVAPPWEKEMALTPIEMDLGALEVIASLPETARPARKKTGAKPSLRRSVFHPGSRKSVVAVELPGGSLMTVITPEQSAWQRAPFISGAIKLPPRVRPDRSPLAIIQDTVDSEDRIDQEKIATEQAILDELVDFVESFGEDYRVKETGLDQFWLKQSGRDYSSPLSIASTLVEPRLSLDDSKSPRKSVDTAMLLREPNKLHDLPSVSMKRASYASSHQSNSSQTMVATPNSSVTHSPPPAKYPYGSPPAQLSPGHSALGTPMSASFPSSPRKVRQVKGKGSSSGGQKMSIRDLIRSAASIV